jgi:hypothetical protein
MNGGNKPYLAVLHHLLQQAAGAQLTIHQQGQVGAQAVALEEAGAEARVMLLQGRHHLPDRFTLHSDGFLTARQRAQQGGDPYYGQICSFRYENFGVSASYAG